MTTVSRMAARGAPNTSAIVAATVHVKSNAIGTLGKSRLIASATMVEANRVGKIGPPRYQLLNESARRSTLRIANARSIKTPYAAGFAMIAWIWDSPENIRSGRK